MRNSRRLIHTPTAPEQASQEIRFRSSSSSRSSRRSASRLLPGAVDAFDEDGKRRRIKVHWIGRGLGGRHQALQDACATGLDLVPARRRGLLRAQGVSSGQGSDAPGRCPPSVTNQPERFDLGYRRRWARQRRQSTPSSGPLSCSSSAHQALRNPGLAPPVRLTHPGRRGIRRLRVAAKLRERGESKPTCPTTASAKKIRLEGQDPHPHRRR